MVIPKWMYENKKTMCINDQQKLLKLLKLLHILFNVKKYR